MCDVCCAEGYILYLPQKHKVIEGVHVLFILQLNQIKYSAQTERGKIDVHKQPYCIFTSSQMDIFTFTAV